MDRIALLGPRGSGKSTVGPLLAERLGWPFLDADAVLEANAGQTIAEIFHDDGEPAFRDLEAANLITLLQRSPLVLATGGGAILRAANRVQLRDRAFVVWLDAPAETCWQRIQADHTTAARRPALTALGGFEEVQRLLLERRPNYDATAHRRVDGSASPEAVAAAILQAWTTRQELE